MSRGSLKLEVPSTFKLLLDIRHSLFNILYLKPSLRRWRRFPKLFRDRLPQ